MQIIITTKEIQASLDLNIAAGKVFTKLLPKESEPFLEKLYDAKNMLATALRKKDTLTKIQAENAFNSVESQSVQQSILENELHSDIKFLKTVMAYTDAFVTIELTDDLTLVANFNEDKLVASMEVFTDELPAFGGLITAAYGLVQSFLFLGERMNRRFKKIMEG